MTQVTKNVLVYDPSDLASLKHVLARSYNHGRALCGVSLLPLRHFRQVTQGEITCPGCLEGVAREIAERAHDEQFDMDGNLHIKHVRRLVKAGKDAGVSPNEIAVRWLHDVIEDSGFTPSLLREHFLPMVVVEAVWLLSWDKTAVTREQYIRRIGMARGREGGMAQTTKLDDLHDHIERCLAYLQHHDAETQASTRMGERLAGYIAEHARIEELSGIALKRQVQEEADQRRAFAAG